jgi:hypothetical protein
VARGGPAAGRGMELPRGAVGEVGPAHCGREVSLTHQGVHGRDVVFLYAPVDTKEEALKRLPQWRAMGAGAILCFASGDLEAGLTRPARTRGPP